MSGLLRAVLPDEVAVAESHCDLTEPLFADEERAIAAAVASRRAEYITVRACARSAFARFGVKRPSLAPGADRAPTWPEGFVGSLTHCAGFRGAALARATEFIALGIDAEPNEPLPEGVWDVVSVPSERGQICRSPVHRDRLLFSAKESVFKAWWPLTGRWLEFGDVTVAFHDQVSERRGAFTAWLATGEELSGRWAADDRHVVTAVALRSTPTARPLSPRESSECLPRPNPTP